MARVYLPPDFNLTCNVWICSATVLPMNGPADFANQAVQKYVSNRVSAATYLPVIPNWWITYQGSIIMRFPRSGLFAGPPHVWEVVCIEVPMGSGMYYRTQWQEVAHEGFPNEYAILSMQQCHDDGTAIPPPHGPYDTGMGSNTCGD